MQMKEKKKTKRVYTPEEKKLMKRIMDGKIYVKVDSVSSSGMSRNMSFYYITRGYLVNCTKEIHELNGVGTMTKNYNLRIGGCGMDMCFHALYSSLPYKKARKRSQRYHTIN